MNAASLSTQNSSESAAFQQALRNYRTGRAQETITELATWPGDRLAAAANAAVPNLSSSDRMAGANLYAEVANALLVVSWPNVEWPEGSAAGIRQTHEVLKVINSALVLLHSAGPAPFGEQLGEEPKRSWYYAAATVLLAYYRGPEATQLVDIGLTEFPNDPLLLTARATISARNRRPAPVAIADYKHAITLAPDLAIAKLRLAQWYLDRRFEPQARPLLQSVVAGTATDSERYFAHLLLARIAANAHKLEEADAEYRQAYRIGAGYQAACIAVSRREDVLEHQERAAAVAEECFGLSDHHDPWPSYLSKNDPDALPHLRAEARGR